MNKTQKVIEILKNSNKPMKAKQLADQTSANLNTIRGLLVRYSNKGILKRTKWGYYKYSASEKTPKKK